jgi:DNA-binding CsgD family transcriptional regulator
LPLSIRGAVLARAAQLSEEDRNIISRAAVLGERFTVDWLVALHGDREAVLGALERARKLSLLYDEPAAPGEVAFRHALTQEVLYGELLAERARPLHEAIALELERRPDRNAVSVQLAHHWRRAGNPERAAIYDDLAGDRAAGIGAFADAVLYYERALGEHNGVSAELQHKLGVALGALNQLAGGIRHLQRAAELYWRAGDFEGFAKNASALGAQLYNSGDAEAATGIYHRAVDALAQKLPPDALNLLRTRIAYNCIAALDFDSASTFLDELPEAIEDPFAAMNLHQTRFRVAAMRGEVSCWRRNAEAAIQAAGCTVGADSNLRYVHTQVALDAVALGEIELARRHLSAAMPPDDAESAAPLAAAASSFEHTLRGDFARAAVLLDKARSAPHQAYAIHVHIKSANFALGICSGDDSRLWRDDSESFLRYGINHGMKLAIGLLGGPYAWALGLGGHSDDAAAWISQIARVLPGPHRFMFAYLAAAQFGAASDVLEMRGQLISAAASPEDRVNKAVTALFDAYAARRGILQADARETALTAGAGFAAIGWPWFAGRAYELGGESRRALEIFRSLGSLRDVRRLQADASGARGSALSSLSSRECEVAELIASGHSNEEISQILHISSRTAEKHVSSALRKLNLRSRLQLGQVLARSQVRSE